MARSELSRKHAACCKGQAACLTGPASLQQPLKESQLLTCCDVFMDVGLDCEIRWELLKHAPRPVAACFGA